MPQIYSLSKYCHLLQQDPLPKHHMMALLLNASENVHSVMELLTQTYLILTQPTKPNIRKYNTLLAIYIMLDSGSSVVVNLLQAYLLDVVFRYALNIHDQPSSTNFRVFPSPRQHKGWNREVLIAIDIIGLAAFIKPYQMFQTYEIQSPSSFTRALDILYEKLDSSKVQRMENNKSEAEGRKTLVRKKFLKNVHEFHREHLRYTHYFVEKATILMKGMCEKNDHMNVLNLIKDNRGYLNSEVLGLAVQFIEKGLKIEHKVMALFLINHLVIYADIQAIMMINYSNIFEKMAEKVETNYTSQELSESEAKYILDFLRNVQMWSRCMPYDNFLDKQNKKPSLIFNLYKKLSQNPRILFPENPFQFQIIEQYRKNEQLNEERNKKIIEELYLHNYVSESESGLITQNSDILRLKSKIVTIDKLLLFENVNESGIDTYMKKIKHEQEEVGRMLEELDDCSLESEAEDYLQKVNGLIKVYNDNRNQRTRYEKIVNHLKKMGMKVPKQLAKKIQNSQNFFDSSSEESINSIKSWIYQKYSRTSQLATLKSSNKFELNYEQLIADDKKIQVPQIRPIVNSRHISQQQNQKGNNKTFKQCSDMEQSFLPCSDRQHQMATNVMNDKFRINSPPIRSRGGSKTKIAEQSQRQRFQQSEQLSVLKTNHIQNTVSPSISMRKPFLKSSSKQEVNSFQFQSHNKKLSTIGPDQFSEEIGEVIKMQEVEKECIQNYDQKTRKKLLRNNIRVIKNQQLQIGTKIQREGGSLRITYYITPFTKISRFYCTVQRAPELNIKIYPLNEGKLVENQQYQLHISVEMIKFAYRLPIVKFSYVWIEQNCWVQSDQFESLLPALSIKFIEHRKIQPTYIERQFSLQSSMRTHEVKVDRNILKDKQSLQKFIPNIVLLNGISSEIIYGAYCIYKMCHFLIKIIIKNQDILWAEGISFPSDDETQCQNILHHYLCMIIKLFCTNPS